MIPILRMTAAVPGLLLFASTVVWAQESVPGPVIAVPGEVAVEPGPVPAPASYESSALSPGPDQPVPLRSAQPVPPGSAQPVLPRSDEPVPPPARPVPPPAPTILFQPVKVDAPPHDPDRDSYWFGPFSETATVVDVDNDGDLDLVAGRNWYEAPLWIRHDDFRSGGRVNGPETENNAEFAMDVDGDGCTDIVSSGWMFMKGAYWYKNPCNKIDTWTSHKVHRAFNMEGIEGHHDLDGDGDEDVLVNHWGLYEDQGMTWLERVDGPPWFVEHVVGHDVDLHGNGLGDIDMDGDADIVTSLGWYENPGGEAAKGAWPYHPDWKFESLKDRISSAASHPIVVHDVNEDGLNDVIVGSAHAYGLAWYEQQLDGDVRTFEQHWLETEFSQFHTLALGDLNGDGRDDLVAGRRLMAHYGADIGAFEPLFGFWYDFNGGDVQRHLLFYNHLPYYGDEGDLGGPPNHAFGMGMNVHVVDVDGDGRNDVVTPSKAGLYIFYNEGPPPSPGHTYRLPTYDEYPTWRNWPRYEALFNGRDFTGWVVPEGDGGHWKVRDFMIDYDARSEAEGDKHLWTEESFCDFHLHVEWRIKEASGIYDVPTVLPDGTYLRDEGGNIVTTPLPNSDSGIFLRGFPYQVNIWAWPIGSGEIWSLRNNEALSPGERGAGVPKMRADHPIGEWNEFDITLIGDQVSVMLNGHWVIENARMEEGHFISHARVVDGQVAADAMPIPPIPECGPIGLQHHGGVDPDTGEMHPTSSLMQFRNIWIDRLDEEEKEAIRTMEYPEGWEILFDGDEEDLDGWLKGPDNAFVVRDGLLFVDREMDGEEHNADYLWTADTYDDFVLDLEFKTVGDSNSGIFLRTSDIADPVHTGIEVQVNNSYGKPWSRGGTTGVLYDLTWPRANPVRPPGEWNRCRIFVLDHQIFVELNGVRVSEADLDQWTTTGRNPDGSPNKFTRPIVDFAREGHIGLQDHGRPVWYRNIRVMRLDDSGALRRPLNR